MKPIGLAITVCVLASTGHSSPIRYTFESGPIPLDTYFKYPEEGGEPIDLTDEREPFGETTSFSFGVEFEQNALPFSIRNSSFSYSANGRTPTGGAFTKNGEEVAAIRAITDIRGLGIAFSEIELNFGSDGGVEDWRLLLDDDPAFRSATPNQTSRGLSRPVEGDPGFLFSFEYSKDRPGRWNVDPVPLPSAGWLLIAGIGALGAFRARDTMRGS